VDNLKLNVKNKRFVFDFTKSLWITCKSFRDKPEKLNQKPIVFIQKLKNLNLLDKYKKYLFIRFKTLFANHA
jgi:hypothetical protein